MIYCVTYEQVEGHLLSIGFSEIDRGDLTIDFEREGELLVLRAPNVNGHVPEVLVNDAFDAAGIAPPQWDVFWCD